MPDFIVHKIDIKTKVDYSSNSRSRDYHDHFQLVSSVDTNPEYFHPLIQINCQVEDRTRRIHSFIFEFTRQEVCYLL
jgi:hypothetical protein